MSDNPPKWDDETGDSETQLDLPLFVPGTKVPEENLDPNMVSEKQRKAVQRGSVKNPVDKS